MTLTIFIKKKIKRNYMMTAALYFVLMMWLPICRASTEEMITIPDPFTLGPIIEDGMYNFSCYNCQGTVGEVTHCGESLTAEEDVAAIDRIPCNNICTKAVSYNMDQKIYVTRNCSQTCDPGCKMRAGTGTCWYCCHGNLCNGAHKTIEIPLVSLVFLSLACIHVYIW